MIRISLSIINGTVEDIYHVSNGLETLHQQVVAGFPTLESAGNTAKSQGEGLANEQAASDLPLFSAADLRLRRPVS